MSDTNKLSRKPYELALDLAKEKGNLMGAMEVIATESSMTLEWAKEIATKALAQARNKQSENLQRYKPDWPHTSEFDKKLADALSQPVYTKHSLTEKQQMLGPGTPLIDNEGQIITAGETFYIQKPAKTSGVVRICPICDIAECKAHLQGK